MIQWEKKALEAFVAAGGKFLHYCSVLGQDFPTPSCTCHCSLHLFYKCHDYISRVFTKHGVVCILRFVISTEAILSPYFLVHPCSLFSCLLIRHDRLYHQGQGHNPQNLHIALWLTPALCAHKQHLSLLPGTCSFKTALQSARSYWKSILKPAKLLPSLLWRCHPKSR